MHYFLFICVNLLSSHFVSSRLVPGSRFPAFPRSRVFLVLRFPRRGSRFEFVRFERMAYQAGNRPARPALIVCRLYFYKILLAKCFFCSYVWF